MAAEANLVLKKNFVADLLIVWPKCEKLRDDSKSGDSRR